MRHRCVVSVCLAALALGAPPLPAQTLDFDEVCGTPPCAAGSAYAASWSIGVSPAALPIVAAGSNGLTGTNGGRYLSVNVFPYQATLMLPRSATFAAVDVARSNLSTAGQTFTLQPLSNGTPVGTAQTITLGNVNQWATVTVTVPCGFNALFLDSGAGGANRTFGVDNVRLAGNCAGFVDIPPTSIFCDATEWLYNRGVTLGCALGQYCPALNVTRAQMALFLQRLGDAVSPVFQVEPQTGFFNVDLTNPFLCTTTTIPPINAPRTATVLGHVQLLSISQQTIKASFIYSTNNGLTRASVPGSYPTSITINDGLDEHITAFGGPLPLEFGSRYVIAIEVRQTVGSGTTLFRCNMRADVFPRTSLAAPFDTADPQAGGEDALRR
jgi:hypothetical protein